MANTYTGYTPKTMEKLILDAGAWFKNFVVGTDTYVSAITAGKLLGATQNGGKFEAKPEYYVIEVDGIKGEAKGMSKIKAWAINLSANVLEVDATTIKYSLGAADIDTTTNIEYDIITGRSDTEEEDYLDNVTWVGTLSGSEKPVIIQVFNALNKDGMSVDFKDGAQGTLAMNFKAHYATAGDTTPPFAIYYPKAVI